MPLILVGRRELFLDDPLVQEPHGDARRVFHHPVARDVVMTFDQVIRDRSVQCARIRAFSHIATGEVLPLFRPFCVDHIDIRHACRLIVSGYHRSSRNNKHESSGLSYGKAKQASGKREGESRWF